MHAMAAILAQERRWRRFVADSTGQDNATTLKIGAKAVKNLPLESHHDRMDSMQHTVCLLADDVIDSDQSENEGSDTIHI